MVNMLWFFRLLFSSLDVVSLGGEINSVAFGQLLNVLLLVEYKIVLYYGKELYATNVLKIKYVT